MKPHVRLGNKFDTDSQPLSLFDIETFAEYTNDGIRVALHLKQLDNFLNVVEFFLSRHLCGLTKHSTESKSFPDGRGRQMEILLLHVAGFPLE
jgi:hypothetical protein